MKQFRIKNNVDPKVLYNYGFINIENYIQDLIKAGYVEVE